MGFELRGREAFGDESGLVEGLPDPVEVLGGGFGAGAEQASGEEVAEGAAFGRGEVEVWGVGGGDEQGAGACQGEVPELGADADGSVACEGFDGGGEFEFG